MHREQQKAPGVPGLLVANQRRKPEGMSLKTPRDYPNAQFRQGAEPDAMRRVGADGETGDFKGLTLSNSGPVFLGSRGFPSGKARIALLGGGPGNVDKRPRHPVLRNRRHRSDHVISRHVREVTGRAACCAASRRERID